MKKILMFLCLVITTIFSVQAQQKNAKVILEVDGVCNSCKTRIENASLRVKGVKYAKWDISTHQLSLILDERKTSVEQIQQAIAKSGHDNRIPNTNKVVVAKEEDYNKVASCCKYRDEEVVKNHPK